MFSVLGISFQYYGIYFVFEVESCEYAKLETFYPMRKLLSKQNGNREQIPYYYDMSLTKWQLKRINSYIQEVNEVQAYITESGNSTVSTKTAFKSDFVKL